MIAVAGYYKYMQGEFAALDVAHRLENNIVADDDIGSHQQGFVQEGDHIRHQQAMGSTFSQEDISQSGSVFRQVWNYISRLLRDCTDKVRHMQ